MTRGGLCSSGGLVIYMAVTMGREVRGPDACLELPNLVKCGHQRTTVRLPLVGDRNGSPSMGSAWSPAECGPRIPARWDRVLAVPPRPSRLLSSRPQAEVADVSRR